MPTPLIGRLRISPEEPKPGESTLVEVLDSDDQALEEGENVSVYINGVPGSRQYIQFSSEGERVVHARVVSGSNEESKHIEVRVLGPAVQVHTGAGASRKASLAILRVQQTFGDPYHVKFGLGERSEHIAGYFPTSQAAWSIRSTNEMTELAATLSDPRSLVHTIADSATDIYGFQVPVAPLPFASHLTAKTFIADHGSERIENIRRTLLTPKVTRFEWDFGDGASAITESPEALHDYSPALDANSSVLSFTVTCKAVHDNIVVRRTLVIHSAYGITKQQGTIVPIVESDIFAQKSDLHFQAQLVVTNLEAQPLTITHRAFVPLSQDPEVRAVPDFHKLDHAIELPPESDTVIGIYPRIDHELAFDVPGFTVYFAGKDIAARPVRFSAIFEVAIADRKKRPRLVTLVEPQPQTLTPFRQAWGRIQAVVSKTSRATPPRLDPAQTLRSWPWDEVRGWTETLVDTRSSTLAVTKPLVDEATGLVAMSAARGAIRGAGAPLRRFAREVAMAGLVPVHVSADGTRRPPNTRTSSEDARWGSSQQGIGSDSSPGPPQSGSVTEAAICDPDNLTEDDLASAGAQHLVCQLTEEEQETLMPGRFMNARKGDVILSPGGAGLIGSLLRSVSPSQRYSHSGIMTRNFDEITHSTASEERLLDYRHPESGVFAGSNGLQADKLKWLWPGVVAQPVEASIYGEPFVDPNNGKVYSISGFSNHAIGVTHNDDFIVVPALVVKPDPLQETVGVRAKLHAIANEAKSEAGRPDKPSNGHYRFYCYTDPSIMHSDIAPAGAGWAEGTFPSVCSSFIWGMAKRMDVHLEADTTHVMPSDLEPEDRAMGGEVTANTPDGLYRYTAAERLVAAEWLHRTLHHQAADEAGWFGQLVTIAADEAANQVVNAFASDDADGRYHDGWKAQQDALAISPDNLLMWDSPSQNGLFGFSEPLIYREPRREIYRISRWKKSVMNRHGSVQGLVRLDGAAIAGANVRIYETKSSITGSDGRYHLADVLLGSYLLRATTVVNGTLYAVDRSITITKEGETFDLDLLPPHDVHRLVQILVDFNGRDDETWPWVDETIDPGPEYYERELGPTKLSTHLSLAYKWGGEVRVEYAFWFWLNHDGSISVTVHALLFEGTSEGTSDMDGFSVGYTTVPKGNTKSMNIIVYNIAELEPDTYGNLAITIGNVQNNN